MACFLIDLMKKYVEKLIDGAIAESRYICCFTCIAKEFEEEKARLEAERTTVGQRVQVATSRAVDIQRNAVFWAEEADKLIQEDTKTKQTCLFGLCPNCIWRYRRGKELANKKEDIKRLIEKAEKLENIELPYRLPDVERYSSQDYISFKSRELKYKELLDALTDDSNYITGLQGMGGTGKTTLAKEVGKELNQSKLFTKVVDTTVSFTPDIKKIQDDIAGPLGLKWEDCNESDRPKKLWSRLTNGEKILLILDDVWGHINFDEIGIPHSDNHKGCRVLINTRDLRVCNLMGCERTIQLELLSEEDAWIMFKRYANLSDSSSKPLLDKGRKIANECKRLPVAIAVIASSLKGQRYQVEWDVALKSLQKPKSMHGVDEILVEIYKCLKFSYDNMKDEKAKGLFLLCSVFREDEIVSTKILTRLGIGLGLFGEDYDIYDDARSQVVVAKNKLLDSCLLLKSDEGSVKMHDLAREVAQWIANKEIRAVNLSNKNQKSLVEREKNIKYLLCKGKPMDVFSCRFDGSKLEILIVVFYKDEDCSCVEFPNSFFENIAGLRVLHLNNNWRYEAQTLLLPQSIQSLTNIRSLLVDRVDLGDISILGNLQSLETLDLFKCIINELPPEITKLKKFGLLNLEECEIRRNNPFEVIKGCSSLEELYFVRSFNGFCQEITFPELQRYHISNGSEIMNDSVSKYVSFVEDGAFFSEETFKYLVQTAEVLRLSRIKGGWRNLIPTIVPIDQGKNDLVELNLGYISQLHCIIDTRHFHSQVQNVFPKLIVLHLNKMENLEELCNGPLSLDSLKSLEKLWIGYCKRLPSLFNCELNLCNLKTITLVECPKLVSLFQLSTSQSLVLLEELRITDCEQLKDIIIIYDNKSRGSMFPKLKVLDVWGCPRLEFILPLLSARDLPVLEAIRITSCDELKYIFGQHQDVELGSLKEMRLNELPNFVDIFPECCHPISSSVKWSSSKDGSKAQIQLDPIKCNIFSWTHICCYGHRLRSTTSTKIILGSKDQAQNCSIVSERAQCLSRQSQILCNIKEIELYHLLKIKSVFTMSIAPKMLETLIVVNCDELKHVINIGDDSGGNNWGNVFPKLKELNIEDCGQLEYIFGHNSHDHQNNNEIHLHLPALKCLNLCNLPSLIGMCPQGYRTTLPLLTELKLDECSQVAIKSIGEFIIHSVSRSLDSTSIKDSSGNEEHFLGLENLMVYNSKVENIFCLNEINGRDMNLGLQKIQLYDMPQMTYPFEGPKNSFALQNLISVTIVRCEKLKIIFSTSILRCLSQLIHLTIEECEELKHIIEEDVENKKMSNFLSPRTCFPKLQVLVVVKCNKLKCVFPVSTCKELPELKFFMIKEAYELEKIFECEGDQKVEIPNLKFVAFAKLPSLCQADGIQFQVVENRFVHNCQNLSLTSTLIDSDNDEIRDFYRDDELSRHLESLFEQSPEDSTIQDTSNENPRAEIVADFPVGVQVTSRHELISSQDNINQHIQANQLEYNHHENGIESNDFIFVETKTKQTPKLLNEQSMEQQCLMNQQHPLGETDTTFKISQENNCLKETEDQSIPKGFASEKAVTTTLSTISETRKESTVQFISPKQKDIKRSAKEGTTLTIAKTITSSTHSELFSSSSGPLVTSEHKTYPQDNGNGLIAIPFVSISIKEPHTTEDADVRDAQETIETNDQVSLNDDASMKVSSIVEEQFSNEDDVGVLISNPSPTILSPIASQSPLMPSEGNPSHIVEDSSLSSLVTRELEQLISKKHLAFENLSLLTNFLVKHPSVHLTDNSLSNRYKGYAYNCLAELLKFLQTHSVLDVLGSSHFEFVELLQDVRSFAFDKDWLDDVERRTLFSSLQVSQDVLQKLLDSKRILTQHVEDLKHQLTSSEAFLESIIQQETQVLEARAALSAPLGY